MRFLLLLTLLLPATPFGLNDTHKVAGRWTTIDDQSGKAKSVVEITIAGGRLSGRIVDLADKTKLGRLCDQCPGDRKDKPIVGLEVIRDMHADGDQWSGGTILDPETGKIYDCKLWLEDGKLKVRGYVAFFYRTQTWVKGKG
ncbi:MAG: DUF2147 domain-containing protein [Flavobacteriales bacterium]|nr:DUF2147 domain-containing protein [Flavobacteriales bacterium]